MEPDELIAKLQKRNLMLSIQNELNDIEIEALQKRVAVFEREFEKIYPEEERNENT